MTCWYCSWWDTDSIQAPRHMVELDGWSRFTTNHSENHILVYRYILVRLKLIFCRCWKWFVLGLLANQILMPLCLIHTWVYRSIGCSLSQQPFCATGAANVLHVLDVFFTLVFFLELLVRLCPGSKTPEESSVVFCCQIIGIVADLLTHFFHLVKVFPRSFTLNMPESIPQKCLLHIHWMIHCTFLPTVFFHHFSARLIYGISFFKLALTFGSSFAHGNFCWTHWGE